MVGKTRYIFLLTVLVICFQGTEVKAITYSNMQIHDDCPTNDIYVIIDI